MLKLTAEHLREVADSLNPNVTTFTCHAIADLDPDVEAGFRSPLGYQYTDLLIEAGLPYEVNLRGERHINGAAFGDRNKGDERSALQFDFLNLLAESL